MNKKGAAIRYREGMNAPGIIFKARGVLVQKMVEVADREGIPVLCEPDMAEALDSLPVGREIPESLYMAAAEILAHCYKVNKKAKDVGIW